LYIFTSVAAGFDLNPRPIYPKPESQTTGLDSLQGTIFLYGIFWLPDLHVLVWEEFGQDRLLTALDSCLSLYYLGKSIL